MYEIRLESGAEKVLDLSFKNMLVLLSAHISKVCEK